MSRPTENLTFKGARIIFKNFSGERGRFNSDRSFSIVLTEEEATVLKEEGWNVKRLEPKEEGDDPLYHLPVKIKYPVNEKKRKPIVVLINSRGNKCTLDEETIHVLDFTHIESVEAIIRPFNYDFSGNKGTSAYVNVLYAKKAIDGAEELEEKYSDLPEDDDPLPWER